MRIFRQKISLRDHALGGPDNSNWRRRQGTTTPPHSRATPSAIVAYDGLIEIEPRSELAVIVCAGLLLRCTVTVEVPTNVCVLIR